MNYLIVGHGRMGRAIDAIAAARGHRRAGILGAGEAPERGAADVAFEFTRPEAAPDNVARLLAAGIPAVCGTTGWDPGSLADPAGGTGWIVAPNFSIGMHLFARVAAEAARTLGRSGLYQPWIHEVHHRGKRDNPSGTALHLAGILRDEGRGIRSVVRGPGDGGPLPADALQVVGTRAGAEPGTHTIGFEGEHDAIRLTHAARGRDGFALGAVLAAEWLVGPPARSGRRDLAEAVDALLDEGSGG